MDKDNLHLVRHRYIPDETTPLSDDTILKFEDGILILPKAFQHSS